MAQALLIVVLALVLLVVPAPGRAAPEGRLTWREQAAELEQGKREAILHRIQQLMHEKVMFAPMWELAFLNGHGPRVEESGLTLITSHAYSSPYEDLRLKTK